MSFFQKGKIILLLMIACSFGQRLQAQLHWESMVLESDTWKYLPATSEPASTWYQSSFSDAAWKSGIGGLGYADGDDATTVAFCNSLYLRKTISIPDVSIVQDLILDIDYDDAFVLYINGVECARSSNVTGTFPAYNATLTTDHEAKMYSGGSPERFQLKPSSLIRGNNVFALQILNQGVSSTDLSARVFIQAKINYSSTLYHAVPSWFTAPVSYASSNIPLVFVQTNGQTIIQNTKIMVDLKTLNSATGINYLTDTTYEYRGKAGIEIRGNTSAKFPKKSYTVETRLADGSNNNVKLLGLPKENDWVFNGPYPDKSLMRNVLAYNLGNKTGKWSPRTKYFELYIDGVYMGVYILIEKIKNDKNRLNLAKLKATDLAGDSLTGGYILKLDRPETTDVEGVNYWISPYLAPTSKQQKEYFLYVDPDGANIQQAQRDYIQTYITNFENAMYSSSYKDRSAGYYPYVDLKSFVDYYIITELSHNLDGYRISTFFHKDRDSKGGKLTMGPFWDYDICFGNANFFSAGNTSGWIVDGMGDADWYAMPFWWQKFRLDPYFNSILKQRWNTMKSDFMNTTYMNHIVDSCANVLFEAEVRNFQKWNILSTYVWPNNYVGGSYANEITYLKNWLRDRMSWMDTQIQAIVDITGVEPVNDLMLDLVTYPNPCTDQITFKYYLTNNKKVDILVTDLFGRKIWQNTEQDSPGIQSQTFNMNQSVAPGVYMYQVFIDGGLQSKGKFVKQ